MNGSLPGAGRLVLVLDNYDSFTWNLVQAIESQGARCRTYRSDRIDLGTVRGLAPDRIILSPGPFGPGRSGICSQVVREISPRVPTLGVCLGMQIIAAVSGASVVPSGAPVHGKSRTILHDGVGIYEGLPNPLEAGLYHSLVVDTEHLPERLEITARTAEGVVMGCRIAGQPIHGVLFHPESFLTPDGDRLIANFLASADVVG